MLMYYLLSGMSKIIHCTNYLLPPLLLLLPPPPDDDLLPPDEGLETAGLLLPPDDGLETAGLLLPPDDGLDTAGLLPEDEGAGLLTDGVFLVTGAGLAEGLAVVFPERLSGRL
jgi:hypothetical protein